MEAFRRWNVRRRSPSIKAIARAGPPERWLVVAGAIGLVAVLVVWLAGVRDTRVLIGLPLVAFTIGCLVDRDGWRIRMATAELARLQVKRWPYGRIPPARYITFHAIQQFALPIAYVLSWMIVGGWIFGGQVLAGSAR